MTPQEHFKLQEKYFSGLCSPEEIEALKELEGDFQLLQQPWQPEMGSKEEIKSQILSSLHAKIGVQSKSQWRFTWQAAAALLVIGAGIFFYPIGKISTTRVAKTNKTNIIIVPGSNKAVLTLSDGSHIDLDNSKEGLLCKQGNVKVGKLASGKLVYQPAGSTSTAIIYNTITTPRGGQYQVVLSDGTKVWLNAASALTFPATFVGKERTVELSGEAYFEVAKNKRMPFKINLNKMAIEVLGTHFNVNAYPDEPEIKTTLLEGSVKLRSENVVALLKPGQQGVFANSPNFNINPVDVQEAIAWKNGYFIFDNENIQGIMRKISRWYDVEVDYKGKIDEGDFGGTVSRFNSVSGVLKSLELTGTVHFKLQGRRITVMP
ncbi:MAG: FecR family protein [Pedobacter sp.]|jgi:transmembrane sensor|nr:FecR family protein [Pedobacter sp.]